MPPGSRVHPTLRTERGRRKRKRRLASIRRRQHVAWLRTVVKQTDPERFARSTQLREEAARAKAKRQAGRAERRASSRAAKEEQ